MPASRVNVPVLEPIVVTRVNTAVALNSPNTVQIYYINVNGQKEDEAITVNAGEKISIKCAALGNIDQHTDWDWTWTWTLPHLYTELGLTETTLANGVDGYINKLIENPNTIYIKVI